MTDVHQKLHDDCLLHFPPVNVFFRCEKKNIWIRKSGCAAFRAARLPLLVRETAGIVGKQFDADQRHPVTMETLPLTFPPVHLSAIKTAFGTMRQRRMFSYRNTHSTLDGDVLRQINSINDRIPVDFLAVQHLFTWQ